MSPSSDIFSQIISADVTTRGPSSPVRIVVDAVHTTVPDFHGCLSGYQWEMLRGKALRAGLNPESLPVLLLRDYVPVPGEIVVGLGEKTLNTLTGKKSIDKWHLSPLLLGAEVSADGRLFLGSFGLDRVNKQYELGVYLEMVLRKAAEFIRVPFKPTEERFRLNPNLEETLAILASLEGKEELAVDVETGYGQINTVGFAWSESDAIAVNVLPDRFADESYFRLWSAIRRVLEGPSKKIFQNFIYDTSYFSAYGIETKGPIFDTMHAMKVLWPELDANLGNVGRIYTKRSYWKDDGRVTDEEGKKKNWGEVRDWIRHFTYNCRDTTGTLDASRGIRRDLEDRGLLNFYNGYVARLKDPVREMCAVGMPLCAATQSRIKKETEARLEGLTSRFLRETDGVNPASPKQVQKWLLGQGVKLPKKFDRASGEYKDTTDSSAIRKIRLKKDLPGLKELQEIKSLGKALSSYVDFDVRGDGRLSYSLNITGTKTLRWGGGKDAWGRGFNIQTIPREGGEVSIKSMFLAPEGYSFCEVDLRQAESRFVAYDSADATLISMLESGADVHSHVGEAILRQMGRDSGSIGKDEFKGTWRQLGKKAGHGLNYGMKPRVFVETVFNELDMVITTRDAEDITKAYFGLFPGIPRWHGWIRGELYKKRKLTAPSGWERYFYGRPGDDMFKEAAAWRPQHTIPWITNNLLIHLFSRREKEGWDLKFITQVHDSLILLVAKGNLKVVAEEALDHKVWHPIVDLPGGRMFIPTEVKVGERMSELREWGTCGNNG